MAQLCLPPVNGEAEVCPFSFGKACHGLGRGRRAGATWSNPMYVYIHVCIYVYIHTYIDEKYNSCCEKLGKKGAELTFFCAVLRVLSQSGSLCDATASSPCRASFPESWALQFSTAPGALPCPSVPAVLLQPRSASSKPQGCCYGQGSAGGLEALGELRCYRKVSV